MIELAQIIRIIEFRYLHAQRVCTQAHSLIIALWSAMAASNKHALSNVSACTNGRTKNCSFRTIVAVVWLRNRKNIEFSSFQLSWMHKHGIIKFYWIEWSFFFIRLNLRRSDVSALKVVWTVSNQNDICKGNFNSKAHEKLLFRTKQGSNGLTQITGTYTANWNDFRTLACQHSPFIKPKNQQNYCIISVH